MLGFVRVTSGALSNWGVGKTIDIEGSQASVAWFDSPLTDPLVESVTTDDLAPCVLDRHTRVFWLDRESDTWRVGRILDADDAIAQVRFANSSDLILPTSELEVRWDRPIDDPSAFLAAQLNDSPQFAQARSRFARSLTTQRGACSGMSALISSIIDLELHQYEVVKRVLQDPVQRYLLADEVGLGKTVEAGVLIRQFVLDNPKQHRVVVLTPPALLVQWRRELRTRFQLGDLLDDSLHVMATTTDPQDLVEVLGVAGLVVVDEAHHLSHDHELYTALRDSIISVPRVLLLSATPVLHNERGFLEMLHLLDPHVYKLENEGEFRQRIEHRQTLAESVAGLVPENLLQIEDFLDDLASRFPDDALLLDHSNTLRDIVLNFPEESDPEYVEALMRLRAHLTETYRLDRRILRNRRRDNPFLTPHRAGVESFEYSSVETARLVQAAEAWRAVAAESVYGAEDSEHALSLAKWFRTLLETMFTAPEDVSKRVEERTEELDDSQVSSSREKQLLVELEAASRQCVPDHQRLEALSNVVDKELKNDRCVVVFCSDPKVADGVAARLRMSFDEPIDRHSVTIDEEPDIEEEWEAFLSDPSHRVLVCDSRAEEGLNLQGGDKTVIHFDLPLAPNRVEQRMGRVDRYGSGNAIRSLALCCVEDRYAQAWFTYLDRALKVFDRSVASLQYLIEDEMQSLAKAVFIEGAEAIDALALDTGGEHGKAERELRRIDDQDALDALTLPDEEEEFDRLAEVDGDWRDIGESVWQWMIDILQFEDDPHPTLKSDTFGFGAFRFCFSYGDRGTNTLIPLRRILSELVQVLDTQAKGAHSKLLKTDWYTCRRATAIGPSAPSEGVRLVRIGETLVEGIQGITDLDDRGRSVAMWRQCRDYVLRSEQPADVYVRCDFIVEADISKALKQLQGETDPLLEKALMRRGEMAFAPFYTTIWVDPDLSRVTDPELLSKLESSYQRATGDGDYRDWSINSERWAALNASSFSVLEVWEQWISETRKVSEFLLRRESELESLCRESVDRAQRSTEGYFAQLKSRIRHTSGSAAESTSQLLKREEELFQALSSAILEPSITLGTIIAVFLSPNPLPKLVAERE